MVPSRAVKRTVATLALVLLGCSETGSTNTPATDAAPKDIALQDAAPADAPIAADGNANTADVPPGGFYLPPGFTLTPFISPDRVGTFSAVEQVLTDGRDYAAVVETDVGRMVIDLTESQTPITVNSFVFLARNHFFDGIAFHRVIPGFVVQGGDPNTLSTTRSRWGTGGPGYTFGLEIQDALRFNARGVVGMARSSNPNSNGSQFYITLAATPNLDGMYTVFGRVVDGLSVLDAIAIGEPPTNPTRMTRVYIVERALTR